MSATVTTLLSAEQAHDRFFALGRAYAADPTPQLAAQVEAAYRQFFIRMTGSTIGIESALDDLRAKMRRRAIEARVA